MLVTTRATIHEIVREEMNCPLPVEVIPNQMGINLCSVESVTWTRQRDGQLVDLTINFIPCPAEL